jgi:SAM-dependent methyltransferase
MWNLSAEQWSAVLDTKADPHDVAVRLRRAETFVPWSQVLVDESADCTTTADLGCGRGEHSAVLARAGRATTLVDWSEDNVSFAQRMFDALGLQGRFVQADVTRPLPLESNSIDMVFSCGVFEYFNAAQIDAIMKEAFRVARKRVIIMVPNAWSIPYRLGKWYLERRGRWEWGGEVPSYTLKDHFHKAGLVRVREFSVGGQHAVDFLEPLPGGLRVAHRLSRGLKLTRHARPSRWKQGYLLVTIGEKPPA